MHKGVQTLYTTKGDLLRLFQPIWKSLHSLVQANGKSKSNSGSRCDNNSTCEEQPNS